MNKWGPKLKHFFVLFLAKQWKTINDTDNDNDTSSSRNDEPDEDGFQKGNPDDNDRQRQRSEENEFAKKFLLQNMTREQARMYIALSTVVFTISLFALIKSSV